MTCEQDRNSRLRQILRPYRAKADFFALGLFDAVLRLEGLPIGMETFTSALRHGLIFAASNPA